MREFGNRVFKYRFLIGAAFVLIAVIFHLSGSSIGMWSLYLPEAGDDGVLLGTSRYIRSDEWAMSTVISFGQTYEGGFTWFNDALRGMDTDMILASNAPVLGLISLTRVFSMGYVLFGIDGGLSFFWYGRLTALFLVTLEFFLLVTNKKKGLSLFGTLLLVFSAAIQWWFHTSALLECIMYGQLAALAFDAYFKTRDCRKRLLLGLGLGALGYAYALALYPAWQVPLVYVFAGMILWVILKYWKKTRFGLKDILPILLALLVLGAGLMNFFITSREGMEAVNGTVYPGARFETGGGAFLSMFQYINTIFYPFKEQGIVGNVCEQSVMFDLFPLGIIAAAAVLAGLPEKLGKGKKKSRGAMDPLLVILLAVNLFFIFWCATGFPAFLAKITFMSNCQPARVLVIFGYVNIILLIRALSLFKDRAAGLAIPGWKAACFAVLFSLVVCTMAKLAQYNYVSLWMFAAEVFALGLLVFGLLAGLKKLFIPLLAVVLFCTGVAVNPVRCGTDVIYENPLVKLIESVNETKEGLWLVDNMDYPMINIPLFVGARTLNSTNNYPAMERWELLDPEGEQEYLYNRYAHIKAVLTKDGPAGFEEGITGDRLTVNLTPEELELFGVNYILTNRDLSAMNGEDAQFVKLGEVDEFFVYECVYQ